MKSTTNAGDVTVEPMTGELVTEPEGEPGASLNASRSGKSFASTTRGRWTIRIVFLGLLLGAWQTAATGVNKAFMATPTDILGSAWQQLFVAGTIWKPFGQSLQVLFLGLLISAALGIPIGLLMGRFRRLGFILDPYVSFLYALPHVALVPFLITTFGFEIQFRLIYVVFSAIWPFIINSMAGVRALDEVLVDTAHAYGANERQIMRRVVLPATIPFLFAGLRQGLSAAWIGVIVSEILSTLVGLGGEIRLSAMNYQASSMFVSILLIMVIAVAIQAFTDWLQPRVMPWQKRATY